MTTFTWMAVTNGILPEWAAIAVDVAWISCGTALLAYIAYDMVKEKLGKRRKK